MRYFALVVSLLTGCGSSDLTPNHIKTAEMLCAQNGGYSLIGSSILNPNKTSIHVVCANKAHFTFSDYEEVLNSKGEMQ